MKNPGKNRSVLFPIIGGLTVAGGIILLIRYFKNKKPGNNTDDSVQGSVASQPKQASSPSAFPIKVGSNNDLVKQLQAAIGVGADGIFGAKTAAALVAQTGKTSISTQAEYDAVIKTLQAKPAIAAGQKRANDLITQWKGSASRTLMPLSNVQATGVTEDTSRALQPNGKNITLKANVKLSHADYVPVSSTTSGYLVFNITRGDLSGKYKVDPAKITVV